MAFSDERSDSLSSDKRSVSELPLFPLDIVLFPGMKMSLHIFEERYKDMVKYCLSQNALFGIILIQTEATGARNPRRIKTFRVGCSARITQVEQLPAGEFNLEIEGIERFRILEQHEVESYRTGIVELLSDSPLTRTTREAAGQLSKEVRGLLKDFLTRQLTLLGQRVVEFDLPDDLAVLSLVTACVLPIDNEDKQTLLELTNTLERLQSERELLHRAITHLQNIGSENISQEDSVTELSQNDKGDIPSAFAPIHANRYHDYICVN